MDGDAWTTVVTPRCGKETELGVAQQSCQSDEGRREEMRREKQLMACSGEQMNQHSSPRAGHAIERDLVAFESSTYPKALNESSREISAEISPESFLFSC